MRCARPVGPPALEPLPLAGGVRARRHLDLRWPGSDPGECAGGRDQGSPGAGPQRPSGGAGGQLLSGGRGAGRADLRAPDRRAGPPPPLHGDHRGLFHLHGADRPVVEFRILCPVPLPHRYRYRRGVRGDEFCRPGADPGAAARLHRPGDQWQLLGGRGPGGAGLGGAARPEDLPRRPRLAAGLPDRRRPGAGGHLCASLPAREPPLADDPRPARGSLTSGRWDRGDDREGEGPLAAAVRGHRPCPARAHRLCRDGLGAAADLSGAQPAVHDPDGHPGLLLQRDLLHLWTYPD